MGSGNGAAGRIDPSPPSPEIDPVPTCFASEQYRSSLRAPKPTWWVVGFKGKSSETHGITRVFYMEITWDYRYQFWECSKKGPSMNQKLSPKLQPLLQYSIVVHFPTWARCSIRLRKGYHGTKFWTKLTHIIYVYMYVFWIYMIIYLWLYIYIYYYIHIYDYIYDYTYIYDYIYMIIYIYEIIYIWLYIYDYIYMIIYIYISLYIYEIIYIWLHIYDYIYVWLYIYYT